MQVGHPTAITRETPENRPKSIRPPCGGALREFSMILSMTGFAAVAAELPGVSLAVELRSVNHRYLDLTLRLPDELRDASSRACGKSSRRRSSAARWSAGSRSTGRRRAAPRWRWTLRGCTSSPQRRQK